MFTILTLHSNFQCIPLAQDTYLKPQQTSPMAQLIHEYSPVVIESQLGQMEMGIMWALSLEDLTPDLVVDRGKNKTRGLPCYHLAKATMDNVLCGGHSPTDFCTTSTHFNCGEEVLIYSQPEGHSDTYPTRYLQPATIVCGLEGSHGKDETRGQDMGKIYCRVLASSGCYCPFSMINLMLLSPKLLLFNSSSTF